SATTMPSILTLLESFGRNQKRREEVEVGRDRTVNVLGMPVGRKDGISLAPLKGLSVGNEDMFGPIAVNDKYNINWGFFSDLSKMLSKTAQQIYFNAAFNELAINVMIVPVRRE
ncbi:unnamed protein product, partial [Onchocerca ochengi]|uniref:WS_DGAT_C domain-containing protein n=1 Tax=Onchocerca ochengi TaxID=42157 RepID=A0A182ENA9_ONCOC